MNAVQYSYWYIHLLWCVYKCGIWANSSYDLRIASTYKYPDRTLRLCVWFPRVVIAYPELLYYLSCPAANNICMQMYSIHYFFLCYEKHSYHNSKGALHISNNIHYFIMQTSRSKNLWLESLLPLRQFEHMICIAYCNSYDFASLFSIVQVFLQLYIIC